MKKVVHIDTDLIIEEIIEDDNTKTYLLNETTGERILLASIYTNMYNWSKYIVKDNYIVIYTTGVIATEIPVNIQAVYDLNRMEHISYDDELIKNIFIYSKPFSLGTVLSTINDFCFGDEKDVEEFIDYLTNNNENIMSEDIKNYIIESHPILENYQSIDPNISR